MLDRPQAAEIPGTPPGDDSELRRLTPCDQRALNRLRTAYEDECPVAFLTGSGLARSSRVIDSFLADADEQTSVARVARPCADATSYMRSVIRSIGFQAKEFCLADLEKIFTMFLSFQRSHGLRTVICIEDAQDCSSWVFDKVFELAELELRERYGLFVVLSGQADLTHHLTVNSARGRALRAMREIPVSPLKLAETREFVVQRVKSEGFDDVSQVIEFEAITSLHEISAGTPDTVFWLCNESLNRAAQESVYPVTASGVSLAAAALGLVAENVPQLAEELESVDQIGGSSIRLSIRLRGRANRELTLLQDCISIGRDPANDVCIPSLLVSRHHALIVKSSEGVKLMDLGSTNGSAVNGEKVVSCKLRGGDRIVLGDCRIEFAKAETTLDDIIMADLVGSNAPNERGVAIDSLRLQRLASAFPRNGRPRISAARHTVEESTASPGRGFRGSGAQDET